MSTIQGVAIPHARDNLIHSAGLTMGRALSARFQSLSDRREAQSLVKALRKLDAHLLYDIGLREIGEEARAPDSKLPKPVIIAVSHLLPQGT